MDLFHPILFQCSHVDMFSVFSFFFFFKFPPFVVMSIQGGWKVKNAFIFLPCAIFQKCLFFYLDTELVAFSLLTGHFNAGHAARQSQLFTHTHTHLHAVLYTLLCTYGRLRVRTFWVQLAVMCHFLWVSQEGHQILGQCTLATSVTVCFLFFLCSVILLHYLVRYM